MPGITPTADSINAAAASFTLQLRQAFYQIQTFWGWLATQDLVATFGFSAADAATLQACAVDMLDLAGIAQGLAPKAQLPYDYRTNTKKLTGGQ